MLDKLKDTAGYDKARERCQCGATEHVIHILLDTALMDVRYRK